MLCSSYGKDAFHFKRNAHTKNKLEALRKMWGTKQEELAEVLEVSIGPGAPL